MSKGSVLFTNNSLDRRAGTELWTLEVSRELVSRGWHVGAFSPETGEVAKCLREAGVEVVNQPDAFSRRPDILHCQHHFETMTALLAWPGVPAIHVCHGWRPWLEFPLLHPRIRRYFAVDARTRDVCIEEHGVPVDAIELLFNAVDLNRFAWRGPPPDRPRKALVFSNYITADNELPAIEAACRHHGVTCDAVGRGVNRPVDRPESILPDYDIVFAKGRCAMEALAVGCAVVPSGRYGAGAMVNRRNFDWYRELNFGTGTYVAAATAKELIEFMAAYDAEEVRLTSERFREVGGLDRLVDRVETLYRDVLAEPIPDADEQKAVIRYLSKIASSVKEQMETKNLIPALQQQVVTRMAERDALAEAYHQLAGALHHERASLAVRLREGLFRLPLIGSRLRRVGDTLAGIRAQRT